MNKKLIKEIIELDKWLNSKRVLVKHPYYISWSFPTNHRFDKEATYSYYAITLGKYVKKKDIEVKGILYTQGATPIEILLCFGMLRFIKKHFEIPKNLNKFWNKSIRELKPL